MMTRTQHAFWLLFGAALFTIVLFLASLARAQAQDAGPGPGPAAAPLGLTPTQPSTVPAVVLDPESNVGGFVTVMRDVAKTSWPGFAVFAALAIVSVVRKRLKQAREGTTGVATATALAFLTVVAASIAMGIPIGQALGGGLVALLTGRAFATQVEPHKEGA